MYTHSERPSKPTHHGLSTIESNALEQKEQRTKNGNEQEEETNREKRERTSNRMKTIPKEQWQLHNSN